MQAFPLTDVKAFMGHADIQTTMIYIHHVPQHDAAERLSKLLESELRVHLGARRVHARGPRRRTRTKKLPLCRGFRCRRQDSNLRHADYDSAALTS